VRAEGRAAAHAEAEREQGCRRGEHEGAAGVEPPLPAAPARRRHEEQRADDHSDVEREAPAPSDAAPRVRGVAAVAAGAVAAPQVIATVGGHQREKHVIGVALTGAETRRPLVDVPDEQAAAG
jgi:hypothetical protein